MNDPAGFASALATRSAPAPKTAEERAAQERLDSARDVVQREIKEGLRDPESGQRYGVTYRRPAGALSGIEEARRQDAEQSGSSASGMTEKDLFKKMLATAGTAGGPFAGTSGAVEGDASLGGRMDAGSSSADRLAAKRMREKAARGPAGLEMSADLVADALGDGRAGGQAPPRAGAVDFTDGGASWRRRMQRRRMEQAVEATGTDKGAAAMAAARAAASAAAAGSRSSHKAGERPSWRDRRGSGHGSDRGRSGPGREGSSGREHRPRREDDRGGHDRDRHADARPRHDRLATGRGDRISSSSSSSSRPAEDRRERERRIFAPAAPRSDAGRGGEGHARASAAPLAEAAQKAGPETVVLGPEAANKLAAQALRAKMRGQTELCQRLEGLKAAAARGQAVSVEEARAAGVLSVAQAGAPGAGAARKRDAWAAPRPTGRAEVVEASGRRPSSSGRVSKEGAADDGDSSGDEGGQGRIGDRRRARKRRRGEDGGGVSDDEADGGSSDLGEDDDGRKVTLVTGLDSRGVPIRSLERGAAAAPEREDARAAGSSSRGKRRLKGLERDADGNVVRYGAADDVSLSELVRRERAGQGTNADAALASSIARMHGSFRESTLSGSRAGADEDADLDVRLLRGEEDRLTPAERRRRDLSRAAAADAKVARADDSDPLNVMSPKFPRHLLVAVGQHWVLAAARGRALHPLQCLLVPREPGGAVASLDEDVYAEGNAWRAALHKAFTMPLPVGSAERAAEDAADGDWEPEPPVFCETVLDARPGRGRRTCVEVVPIPAEAAADAGIFFGKALTDAEEDPTHAAVIHTQGKGLRRCVPPGFPYAHVGWAGGGMVHPIEDARTFSPSLLLDVAAGLLGVPPAAFGRRDQARPVSEGSRAAEQVARRLLARGLPCADMAASAKLGAAVARVQPKSK